MAISHQEGLIWDQRIPDPQQRSQRRKAGPGRAPCEGKHLPSRRPAAALDGQPQTALLQPQPQGRRGRGLGSSNRTRGEGLSGQPRDHHKPLGAGANGASPSGSREVLASVQLSSEQVRREPGAPARPATRPPNTEAGWPFLGEEQVLPGLSLALNTLLPVWGGGDSRTSGEGGSLSARLFKIYPTATPLSHVRILCFFFFLISSPNRDDAACARVWG